MASLLATSVAALALAAAPQPKLEKKTAQKMVIGGAVATAVTTWAGGMVAATFLDSSDPERRRAGRLMPLPVAGPILAAATSDSELRPVATMGVYQGAGLAILTVGAVSLSRHRRADDHPWRPDKSSGVILITQGVMWLGISWGMTYGFAHENAKAGDPFAQRLQVPVVGGLLAAPRAPSYTRGYLGLTSSAFQLLSAGAIVFGATSIAVDRKRRHMSLLPVPSRDGGQVMFAMRF